MKPCSVPLEEFLRLARERLDLFERYWKENNAKAPEAFPMEQLTGDWDEQLDLMPNDQDS